MAEEVKKMVDVVSMLLGFPAKRFHVDYDKEADVLYISKDLRKLQTWRLQMKEYC